KNGNKRRWGCGFLYIWAAFVLFALHQAHHTDDFESEFSGRLDGLNRGCAGGADVVDDDYARALLTVAFDALSGAVRLFCLAYHEPMQLAADDRDCNHDGIGTQGEATNGLR